MKNSNYYFSKRVLLIEFLIREQKFYGKGNVRTTLPPDSFFYTGKSKADGYASPLICFDDNKPYLLKEITEEKFNKIFTENTNIVCSTSEEYVDKNRDKYGVEYIVFPNPMYGDWEGGLYKDYWKKNPEEKLQLRYKSLKIWNGE